MILKNFCAENSIDRNKCVIVFSGFNERAVIAFLRTLESNNINYAIIAKSYNDNIFLSNYKNKVLAVRNSETLILEDLIASIKKIKEQYDAEEYIIAPTTEALNRVLIEERKSFEEIGCVIPLVNKHLYELISDKYSFGKICSRNGIAVPKEIEFSLNASLPIVAKPKKYFSPSRREILSPILIKDSKEFELFCKNYNTEDFYYQEFVEGKCLYLLYYFHSNGMIYKFSQENLIQQPAGKSMVAAISTNFHNSEESLKYEKLFKSLKFNGLVMIEVKQKEDINYMIEANPRFWGPSQLFVDASMNFFEAFLHDYGLIKSLPKFKQINKITRYYWLGGIISTIRNNSNLNFYNIVDNNFFHSLPQWIENDIYRREDTIEIFKKEFLNGR
jgi:predicted ATP-grasp superfamily ATP-dependent carboligase